MMSLKKMTFFEKEHFFADDVTRDNINSGLKFKKGLIVYSLAKFELYHFQYRSYIGEGTPHTQNH